jgi:RNA recognition motif-containing protein
VEQGTLRGYGPKPECTLDGSEDIFGYHGDFRSRSTFYTDPEAPIRHRLACIIAYPARLIDISGVIMQQNKLYVGNLPYTVDEAQLRDLFSQYGEIEDLALIMDRDTGRPKGFAFITFGTQQAAEKALAQNGKDVGGRPLKVNIAEDRKPKSGGRGGGFGGGRSRW